MSKPRARELVLLVDDDETFGRSMERVLRSDHWDVITAQRAFGVLNLVAEHRPRVVVLDVIMPGLDGDQLAELLREDAELAETRIVLHSGMDSDELALRASKAGADGFVVKGQRPSVLLDAIRAFRA